MRDAGDFEWGTGDLEILISGALYILLTKSAALMDLEQD